MASVISVPKPGKPLNEGNSYRPITLLSPVVQVLETLVLPFLKNSLPLADHQHGFRQNRSTTTALCEQSTTITDGLNSKRTPERSIMVALDLSKAFDTVSHTTLLQDVQDPSLPNTIKRWLSIYMADCQSYLEYRSAHSTLRSNKQRASPLLFTFLIRFAY